MASAAAAPLTAVPYDLRRRAGFWLVRGQLLRHGQLSVRFSGPRQPDDYGPACMEGWLVINRGQRRVKDERWAKGPEIAQEQASWPLLPTDRTAAGRDLASFSHWRGRLQTIAPALLAGPGFPLAGPTDDRAVLPPPCLRQALLHDRPTDRPRFFSLSPGPSSQALTKAFLSFVFCYQHAIETRADQEKV